MIRAGDESPSVTITCFVRVSPYVDLPPFVALLLVSILSRLRDIRLLGT